jgi:pimeloyl-ACP methyl ester carboxylesterase
MKKQLTYIFLIIMLGLTFSCRQGEEVAVEKKPMPTIIVDNAISADGVSIAYEVRGEGEPALAFVHGWCCDRSYWNEQLPHFSEKQKVVAIDLAGHGGSGLNREEWTIQAFGRDIFAVVEKLSLDRVVLIGHSMGGYVILEAARLMPQRVFGLVGVDTLQDFEIKYTQEQFDNWIRPLRVDFIEGTKTFVRTMFTPNSDPDLIEKITADMSSAPPTVGLEAFRSNFDFQNNEIVRVLKEIRAPITCINSDKYPTYVEANQRHSPSYKAKIMSGVGHFNMIEDPATFNRLLEETIQEFIRQ